MSQETLSRRLLTPEQITQKVKRIAYEIYERNFDQDSLLIAGVLDRGYLLAERICHQLDQISHFSREENTLNLVQVSIEKFTAQQTQISFNGPTENFAGQCIILVDDVLNTGRTLAYCLSPFLQQPIKKLEIAVLVNRSHIQFPVLASYTGLELATTLQEHIEVVFDDEREGVYLH